jgi:putative transposase
LKKTLTVIEHKKLVDYAIATHGCSVKRGCKLFDLSRSHYHYVPKKGHSDDEIKELLLGLAAKHKRYGFKKMFSKLRQAGFGFNHKRVYRIYCELRLNLRKKPKKRLLAREKTTLS